MIYVQAFLTELGDAPEQNLGLMFSFDGAARGNPGPSSSGVCAWWGHFNADGFYSKGSLLQKGTRLGTGTNNTSEAQALASALRTALHYFYWVIEQTTHLVSIPSGNRIRFGSWE